ncbi:MAG TPA: phosphotransferase [Candidatus Dormibacteraeota bacterium]
MSWKPEVLVDEAPARRLIGTQFPELDTRRLQLLGEGWDMTVWLVDGAHVFRFPRREIVVPGLLRELEVLPLIAAELPLAIPEPRFVGRPDAAYPWPFYGAWLIPGLECGQAGLDQAARDALAPALAGFLRRLHELPPPRGLPDDPMGRGDMAIRVPLTREALARLHELGVWTAPHGIEELLDQALALPPAADKVLVHGDLHLRHLLVDGARASGVIDWIDVSRAPRSVDLVLYWSLFSAAGRGAFSRFYGELDEATLLRARVLSLNLCALLADYAHVEGIGWLESEAVAGLERTAV